MPTIGGVKRRQFGRGLRSGCGRRPGRGGHPPGRRRSSEKCCKTAPHPCGNGARSRRTRQRRWPRLPLAAAARALSRCRAGSSTCCGESRGCRRAWWCPMRRAQTCSTPTRREFLEASLASGLSPYTAGRRGRALEHLHPLVRRAWPHAAAGDHHARSWSATSATCSTTARTTAQPLAFSTQTACCNPVRAFFKWLTGENHMLYNPASELELPKRRGSCRSVLLTVAEVESDPRAARRRRRRWGLRDRAILETLYSTGIRRAGAGATSSSTTSTPSAAR